jgi:hypothetical protein
MKVAFYWHPSLGPVRKTERFRMFARKIGLVDYWRAKGWPEFCHPTIGNDFECNYARLRAQLMSHIGDEPPIATVTGKGSDAAHSGHSWASRAPSPGKCPLLERADIADGRREGAFLTLLGQSPRRTQYGRVSAFVSAGGIYDS